MVTFLRDLVGFLRFVLRRWRDDRCPQIAGSLTYTTLLALAPVFAVVVAILSSAPLFEDVLTQIKIWLLLNLTPEIAGKIITVYMVELARNAARLTWTGVIIVVVLSVWLMLTIDRTFNYIWRVRVSRPYWISIVGYLLVLFTGPLLIGASVSVTTYITSPRVLGTSRETNELLLHAASLATSAIAFFLIYRIVPHRPSPWRHALLGGIVAAILFEAAKDIFAIWTKISPTYSIVYGTFAVFPLFLLWLYFSWSVVLFGAELTASAAFWRDGLWKRPSTAAMRFRDAVALTQLFIAAGPEPVAFKELREKTGFPAGELEETLAQMIDAGVVHLATRDGYVLTEGTREVLSGAAATAEAEPTAPRRETDRSDSSAR